MPRASARTTSPIHLSLQRSTETTMKKIALEEHFGATDPNIV